MQTTNIILDNPDVTFDIKAISHKLELLTGLLNLPYNKPDQLVFDLFYLRSSKIQKMVYNRLTFYHDVCAEAVKSKLRITEKQLAWLALRILGYIPPSDLFHKISDSDLIEIYDATGVQLYRSFSFSDFTTYSLEELLLNPWHELFERNEHTTKLIFEAVKYTFQSASTPFKPNIPTHQSKQKLKHRKGLSVVTFNLISPLFDSNGVKVALLATSSIELILDKNGKRIQEKAIKSSNILNSSQVVNTIENT